MASLEIEAKECNVSAYGNRTVTVSLEGVEISDIISNFKIEEILKEIDSDEIMDFIGEERFREYFGISD